MKHRIRVAIGPSSFAQLDATPWAVLEDAGIEIVPNPYGRRLTEDEIRRHLQGVNGLIAGLEPLNRSVLHSAPELKAIARVGVGMSNVDTAAAETLGIAVSNTPDAPTEAVAELTLAAFLSLARRIPEMNAALHEGRWSKKIGRSVRGAEVLIIGMGRIGSRVAEHLNALGARIRAYDPGVRDLPEFVEACGLEEGLRQSDFVTIHAGGEEEILGPEEFGWVRDGAYVLNAGRGGLVNEAALVESLDAGRVGGAWLDVFPDEPYEGPLMNYPQVLLTPHVGTYSLQCRSEMEMGAVRNLLRDLGIT